MSQTYFAQVAEQWDEIRAQMFSDAVRDVALSRTPLGPDAVVADVGAGTGFLAQELARRAARVYVVDNSPEMLGVARRNLAAFHNVEYRLAGSDTQPLPLPDGQLDAVLANMALHHMPDPAAAIRDMVRTLKPGGRLVITDLDEHSYTWLRVEQHDVWLGFKRPQVQAWFEAAGLANVLIEDTRQTCECDSQSGQERAAVTIFVASGARPDVHMDEAVSDHYRQLAVEAPARERIGKQATSAPVRESSCCSPAAAQTSSCCAPAQAAQPVTSSCCAPAASAASISDAERAARAAEILDYQPETDADLALGCGNAVGLAALKPGETVLDIGSGAGADVFPSAALVGLSGKVIGVDRLPEMLDRARKTAERLRVPNVEFRQGDALALPAAEGEVDVVMSNCVINLVQDKGRVFREAYRVLKSGGRLAISDVVTDRPFSPAQRQDAASWASCVAGALAESEYLGLIRQAGFRDLRATRSEAMAAEDGTLVYSLLVSAVK